MRAEHCGNLRAARAEWRAHEDRERNTVLRSRVRVEQHRNEHDEVTEEDGEDGLLPIHAPGDERSGQHVGRDLHGHREPQRDVVVRRPGAAIRFSGREVCVVKTRVGRELGRMWRAGSDRVGRSRDQASPPAFASRLTKRPRPVLPRNLPGCVVLSTTSSPREKTLAALPFTFQPSNML